MIPGCVALIPDSRRTPALYSPSSSFNPNPNHSRRRLLTCLLSSRKVLPSGFVIILFAGVPLALSSAYNFGGFTHVRCQALSACDMPTLFVQHCTAHGVVQSCALVRRDHDSVLVVCSATKSDYAAFTSSDRWPAARAEGSSACSATTDGELATVS